MVFSFDKMGGAACIMDMKNSILFSAKAHDFGFTSAAGVNGNLCLNDLTL
jgi:hypothetical protein